MNAYHRGRCYARLLLRIHLWRESHGGNIVMLYSCVPTYRSMHGRGRMPAAVGRVFKRRSLRLREKSSVASSMPNTAAERARSTHIVPRPFSGKRSQPYRSPFSSCALPQYASRNTSSRPLPPKASTT
eukprot:6194656-Pleurochrysis_carterae.AAC.1